MIALLGFRKSAWCGLFIFGLVADYKIWMMAIDTPPCMKRRIIPADTQVIMHQPVISNLLYSLPLYY